MQLKCILSIVLIVVLVSGLQDMLSQISNLPAIKQRAICCVIGAAVGDAASYPFHRIEDKGLLAEMMLAKDRPEFCVGDGRRSCYGDLSLAMLRSLPMDNKLLFDADAYFDEVMDIFGPQSTYASASASAGTVSISTLIQQLTSNQDISGNPTVISNDGLCSCIPLIGR
jgi:hypothetical protein